MKVVNLTGFTVYIFFFLHQSLPKIAMEVLSSGVETETVQHITCCCEALAPQRYVFGKPSVGPKDISRASVKDLCLFVRDRRLLNLCRTECLGLHSKPLAEVLSERGLAGPK